MFRKLASFIAQLSDKTICFDISENRKKILDEFQRLLSINEPEKFEYHIKNFQIESSIMDRFATEKNNRLILVMTFMMAVMTLVILFKK